MRRSETDSQEPKAVIPTKAGSVSTMGLIDVSWGGEGFKQRTIERTISTFPHLFTAMVSVSASHRKWHFCPQSDGPPPAESDPMPCSLALREHLTHLFSQPEKCMLCSLTRPSPYSSPPPQILPSDKSNKRCEPVVCRSRHKTHTVPRAGENPHPRRPGPQTYRVELQFVYTVLIPLCSSHETPLNFTYLSFFLNR
jgi:hypothetical protein